MFGVVRVYSVVVSVCVCEDHTDFVMQAFPALSQVHSQATTQIHNTQEDKLCREFKNLRLW